MFIFQMEPRGRFSVSVDFKGESIMLTFKYNTLNDYWTMDIEDVVYGIKVLHRNNMIHQFEHNDKVPLGMMTVLNSSKKIGVTMSSVEAGESYVAFLNEGDLEEV